tara:strand:+ start:1261 stop:1527 length:267 start_codon:yes stop_codon:yes gene_type:complete
MLLLAAQLYKENPRVMKACVALDVGIATALFAVSVWLIASAHATASREILDASERVRSRIASAQALAFLCAPLMLCVTLCVCAHVLKK